MAGNEPYFFADWRRDLAAKAKAKQAQGGFEWNKDLIQPWAQMESLPGTPLANPYFQFVRHKPVPGWAAPIRKPLQYDWEIQAGDRERLNKWKQGQDFHPPTEGFWSHQTSLGKSPQEIDSLWDKTPGGEKDEWFNKREFDKELQSQGSPGPRPTTPHQAPMREAAEARASGVGGDAQTLFGPAVMQMHKILKTGLYDPVGKRPSVEGGTGGTIGPRPQVMTTELRKWLDQVIQGNLSPQGGG